MFTNTQLTVVYDGEALTSHSMDVRELAPALLSLGKLFDESNRVLNGENTQIKLQVKAHEAGSFEILLELSQSLGNQISGFLTGDLITSALNLKELILGTAGLIYLIKKLKGGKPLSIKDLKNGMVRIEIEGETFEAPLKLLRLYQDIAIRKTVEEVLKPLKNPGIDSFKIKQNKKVIELVNKSDLGYYTLPEIDDEKITENEHEASYSIVSLAFKEDNKWRLHDGNNTISVSVKDEDFLNRVESNEISFTKGDILVCKIKMVQFRTNTGLKTEYELLEVKEHKQAARQLSLLIE
jgi:hypothetical protein